MRRLIIFLLPLLIIIYLIGPKPEVPIYDKNLPQFNFVDADELESYIVSKESTHKLKPGNESQIIWTDSSKTKTEYAILYLHGFSASSREGAPIHTELAESIGANLYLPRLSDHGIDTVDALFYFTPDRLWESGKEALTIAKHLGEKVILLSTSTGGTLALMLAAQYPDDVHAMINLSPNVRINNPLAPLLNNPWGLQITRLTRGSKLNQIDYPEERKPYWNVSYRYEALTQLQQMLETEMIEETFQKIVQPTLNLYYYKDEDNQDPIVRVDAMLWMHENLATTNELKRAVALPDVNNHVIACDLTSNDLDSVRNEIFSFIKEVLEIKTKEINK
jgi:esterase/lipase